MNVRLDKLEQRFQARKILKVRRQVVENSDEEENSEQSESNSDTIINRHRRGE